LTVTCIYICIEHVSTTFYSYHEIPAYTPPKVSLSYLDDIDSRLMLVPPN